MGSQSFLGAAIKPFSVCFQCFLYLGNRHPNPFSHFTVEVISFTDQLVHLGVGFLQFGPKDNEITQLVINFKLHLTILKSDIKTSFFFDLTNGTLFLSFLFMNFAFG